MSSPNRGGAKARSVARFSASTWCRDEIVMIVVARYESRESAGGLYGFVVWLIGEWGIEVWNVAKRLVWGEGSREVRNWDSEV